MTDGQLLYLCLAGFYLLECLHWLPSGCVSFRSWRPGGRWFAGRSALEFTLAGFQPHAGSWIPTGGFVSAMDWPFLPETDGVRIGPGQVEPGRLLPWSDLHIEVEDRTLWLTSQTSVECATPVEARRLGVLLSELASSDVKERETVASAWWTSTTSTARARRALRIRKLIQSRLAFPCWIVFVLCFGTIPAIYWFVGWKNYALLLAIVLLLGNLAEIALRTFRLEKRLFHGSAGERWLQAIQNILLPVHAMKAAERLGSPLAMELHPVCLARVLLPPEAATAMTGGWFRRWKFMADSDPMRAAQAVWLPKIETWMHGMDFDLADLQRAPKDLAPNERYCPRCHTTYGQAGISCLDCGGIKTVQTEH